MEFRPLIRKPKPMDARIFAADPMSLRDEMLRFAIDKRVAYDAQRNCLFVNLENLHIKTRDDVDRLRQVIEPLCQRLGKRVTLVANYDDCHVDTEVADTYAAAISYLQQNYYGPVLRYSTSAFMRRKLGEGLERRGVAPHILESSEDAQAFIALLGRPDRAA
jgi:propionate CoA-transferase